MNRVIIKNIPIRYYSYFQWFLLALYEQENENNISLKFNLPFYQYIYYFVFNDFFKRVVLFIDTKIRILSFENLLEGSFEINNKIVEFCYDRSDTPFTFQDDKLKKLHIYFKAQCPKIIDKNGFSLSSDAKIEYSDVVLKNTEKIYPSMIGPRTLGLSISYKHLKQKYNQMLSSRKIIKEKEIMCYFGDAVGPKPELFNNLNIDEESNLLAYFGNKVNHPNEKRYKIYKIIKQKFSNYDARVINKGIFGNEDDKDEPIPYSIFNEHVSKFQYNMNVSGYRLSIPNRFIESFIVGTAMITDKLSVKWYQNFDNEVYEISELGYLPDFLIDWKKIEHELVNFPKVDAIDVIDAYEKKWSPKSFGSYILNVLTNNI
jgi:hypothetical protein